MKTRKALMNDWKQIHTTAETSRGVRPELYYGSQVKDLITKFFFRDDQLCFHILLLMEEGGTLFFQEYTDYIVYKNALGELEKALCSNALITLSKINSRETSKLAKVA